MVTRVGVHRFRLANTEFEAAYSGKDSTASRFRINKPVEAIEGFARLRDLLRFKNILHLAGEDTGSAALTALVGAPAKLVAVSTHDVAADPVPEFARLRGIDDRLRTYHGVALDDRRLLAQIANDEFGAGGIDVVIDDASDRLAAGLSAFDTLFPLVKSGGSYIIERWSWDHFGLELMMAALDVEDARSLEAETKETVKRARATKGEFLEAIVRPFIDVARTRPDLVSSVSVSRYLMEVRRGPAAIDASTFRLKQDPAG
jgi:hypothetical protein